MLIHFSISSTFINLPLATAIVISAASCYNPAARLPDKPIKAETNSAPPEKIVTKPGSLSEIPVGSVYQLVQARAALIYDVRPTLFYKMGHIPDAISFPKSDFENQISKHEPDIREANKNSTPVIFYCSDAACPDALIVADQLVARGHDITLLRGGYDSWKQATR